MEHINRIELQGFIGSVKTTEIGDRTLIRLCVATNSTYKTGDGCPVIETTWHNVSYWLQDGEDASKFTRGVAVHITGRQRNQRYTASDGTERYTYEVIANTLEVIEA